MADLTKEIKRKRPTKGVFSDPENFNRLREMIQGGCSNEEIAKHFGMKDKDQVYRLMAEYDIQRPKRSRKKLPPPKQPQWFKDGGSMDPENYKIEERDGVEIKVYPPGYAVGTKPQRNIGEKSPY